jgi:glycosyltransferase involved in cell wall biosynthesis
MIKRKKIIYCITKANWGGAQRYVYDLATSLSKENFEISVLTGAEGILTKKLEIKGVETIILENLIRDVSFLADLKSLINLTKIFKREKPDIIHLNSSKIGLLGALAGRLACVPKIIFTSHGWAFNEDRDKWQKKTIQLLSLLTIRLSHKTIAVSEQTKKQISNKDYYKNKITVVKNGLDPIDFYDSQNAKQELLKKLPGDLNIETRPWLGTISELHKNKGLKYIIEAIHLLDLEIEDKNKLPIFIIIGEGEKREKLQQRINRYKLEDTIFLVGQITEAAKYLKAFDIFTLTSITEAMPYVILEAGQAGLPIIASSVGGIPEIIEDMRDGILIRPKEPIEIQKAIDFLLANPDKRSILSQNIKKRILLDFDKQTMVKKTVELYN